MISFPKELKDFSFWLNPTNLQAFHKLEVIQLGKTVFSQSAKPISKSINQQLSTDITATTIDRGRFSLRLYFYQLLHSEVFCLDLRSIHFNFDQHWHYHGTKFAYQFSPNFRKGLVEIYSHYYLSPEKSLLPALQNLGLIHPSWDDPTQRKLEEIFLKHFNRADSKNQNFQLSQLFESFTQIFSFIKRHQGKVPTPFASLGIYLTSLYMNLNDMPGPLDVKDCFWVAHQISR